MAKGRGTPNYVTRRQTDGEKLLARRRPAAGTLLTLDGSCDQTECPAVNQSKPSLPNASPKPSKKPQSAATVPSFRDPWAAWPLPCFLPTTAAAHALPCPCCCFLLFTSPDPPVIRTLAFLPQGCDVEELHKSIRTKHPLHTDTLTDWVSGGRSPPQQAKPHVGLRR